MPFLTNVPLPQCLQHSSATRCLLARDHDRGCTRYLLEVKCLRWFAAALSQIDIGFRQFLEVYFWTTLNFVLRRYIPNFNRILRVIIFDNFTNDVFCRLDNPSKYANRLEPIISACDRNGSLTTVYYTEISNANFVSVGCEFVA